MKSQTLVIIALLVFVGVAAAVFSTGIFSTTSGMSVLSVSAPDIDSSDSTLKNLNWLVTTRLGGSDEIQFTMFPDDFEARGGLKTERRFSARAESVDEVLRYNINAMDDFRIYSYTVTDVMSVSESCGSDVVAEFVLTRPLVSDLKFCVVRSFEGRYGTLSNPAQSFSADLLISNGQQQIRRTISSDVGSVDFTDSTGTIATATWQGNLVTGNAAPSVPEIAVIGSRTGNNWRFVSRTKLSSYQNAQEDFLRIIDNNRDKSFSTWSPDEWNDLRDELSVNNLNLEYTRDGTVFNYDSIDNKLNLLNPTSESNAFLEFSSETRLNNPVVTWWIRADWLGVSRSSGLPQIISASSTSFGNSEQGLVNLKVKNNGGASVFLANIDSCNGFRQTSASHEFYVGSGETVTTGLFVDVGSTNIDLSESCDVVVRDRANPSNSDVAPVSLSFEATRVCTPGQYSIVQRENSIYECADDGLSKHKVVDCDDEGAIASFTGSGSLAGYECLSQEQAAAQTGSSSQDGFNTSLFLIALLIGLVISSYATMMTSRSIPRDVNLRGFVLLVVFLASLLASLWLVASLVGWVASLFTLPSLSFWG